MEFRHHNHNIGLFDTLNPTISLPWVMPVAVKQFITIGLTGAVAALIVVIVDALIYYPFFKKADRLALAEEQNESVEEVLEEETVEKPQIAK